MKILKIFGIVVAVHAAAFMFVFAIPGCRSTTPRPPSPGETSSSDDGKKLYYPGMSGYSTTTPPATDDSSPVSNADLNPGVVSAPQNFGASPVSPADSSSVVRFNPTRPNTPTASALQTAPVTDVQHVTTYTVVPRDSLWSVAKKHGITTRELADANNLNIDAVLAVGKKLIIPGKAPAVSSENTGVGGDTMTYTVKAGDSLSRIAQRAGTTTGAIQKLNKLKGDVVNVGQKLVLPASADTAAALASTPSPTSQASAGSNDVEYVVKPGETLGQIARRFGVSQAAIGATNHISDPRRIQANQKLIIPGGAHSKASTPAPTPAPTPTSEPETPAPSTPFSPVNPADSNPISAPVDQPPVVPVEGSSPIAPAQE
jgi:LysM repeat protein